jgi:hypothetical protein
MNNSLIELQTELQATLSLYHELLGAVETESTALRQPGPFSPFESFSVRRRLLPDLEQSVPRLRQHRANWLQLTPAERAGHREIGVLLRQCQDLILRVLMLDRENEQSLLRHGLLGPRHLPSHHAQRPHYVADLYRRQGAV